MGIIVLLIVRLVRAALNQLLKPLNGRVVGTAVLGYDASTGTGSRTALGNTVKLKPRKALIVTVFPAGCSHLDHGILRLAVRSILPEILNTDRR